MKHIELQRVAPADIEARSMELIGQELGERVFPAEQLRGQAGDPHHCGL